MSLTVIIPSRNIANLVPCVEAVRKHEPQARIIAVDDGLGFENRERMRSLGAEVIGGEAPFVFARNINKGIDFSIHSKYCDRYGSCGHYKCNGDCESSEGPDVIILNDDAQLRTPGGFSLLQRTAQEHPEYGLIAATCNNVGNRNQWQMGTGRLREEPRMVCFVAVLIPRRTIETVGLLDERYTGYGCDDDDYSFSVRKAGLKIGIHDGCYVDHGSLTSSYRGPAGAGGNFLPNLALFIEKWGTDNWGRTKEQSQFAGLFPEHQPA